MRISYSNMNIAFASRMSTYIYIYLYIYIKLYIYIYIYIYKFKAKKVRNVYRLNENEKHFFLYKYFDVFTKSSTVHMDQIFYKKMYSQQ